MFSPAQRIEDHAAVGFQKFHSTYKDVDIYNMATLFVDEVSSAHAVAATASAPDFILFI